ncbi:hypothetical protein F0L74_10690 [Chitinophaga agrisoli]|uniref:WD40 repeat protein n=1 Tax=Chitinophaga agrisoli TaxID=2607653 RepID=A0A5B2VWF7_9BACT|nr:hypothetical protein [Chitinophaga agrisoli]KAA2242980.1 hypothetical protein F0L74_10690 [Chitinophaga agrisoli]
MYKTHLLTDPASGKISRITWDNDRLITETGKPGKTRQTEKQFATAAEAGQQFEKKEWELLKKGHLFRDDNAAIGQPCLHYCPGLGYTGALSFQDTPNGIYVYKHGSYTQTESKDFLVQLLPTGELLDTIELPESLPWNIVYNETLRSLVMDVDHYIYQYNLDTKTFTRLTPAADKPASFIAASKQRIVYAVDPQLYVWDLPGNTIRQRTIEAIMVNGSIPFAGAISKDGNTIAFHNTQGEIELLDAVTLQPISRISGDFNTVADMQFIENDRTLIIRETYGSWGIRFYSLDTLQEIKAGAFIPPGYSKDILDFAINEEETLLVLEQRSGRSYVYNLQTAALLYEMKLDHCVKNAEIRFVKDLLGVRTDYGCFSLYRIS